MLVVAGRGLIYGYPLVRISLVRIVEGSQDPWATGEDDMELHPRDIDGDVVRPMRNSYSGQDSQLATAICVSPESR